MYIPKYLEIGTILEDLSRVGESIKLSFGTNYFLKSFLRSHSNPDITKRAAYEVLSFSFFFFSFRVSSSRNEQMFTTKFAVIEPSRVVVITLCHEIYESNLLEWNRLSSSLVSARENLLSAITLKSEVYTYAGFVSCFNHDTKST